jgi:hypothetical protein
MNLTGRTGDVRRALVGLLLLAYTGLIIIGYAHENWTWVGNLLWVSGPGVEFCAPGGGWHSAEPD